MRKSLHVFQMVGTLLHFNPSAPIRRSVNNETRKVIVMKTLFVSYTLSLTLLSVAFAADEIRIGVPGYGGNGCPAGTLSANYNESTQQIEITLDAFTAEAGNELGNSVDRKSCDLAFPIHVPAGLSIKVLGFETRGFSQLPAGASAKITAEMFISGGHGGRSQQDFRGPQELDYLFQIQQISDSWTPCGGLDSILRVNYAARVVTNRQGQSALITTDSMSPIKLQVRRCF